MDWAVVICIVLFKYESSVKSFNASLKSVLEKPFGWRVLSLLDKKKQDCQVCGIGYLAIFVTKSFAYIFPFN